MNTLINHTLIKTFFVGLSFFTANILALESEYEVPVPPALKANALFEMTGVEFDKARAGIRLSYFLPKDLVAGAEEKISFERTAKDGTGLYQLTSPQADASCLALVRTLTCLVKYHRLGNTPEQLAKFLNQRYAGRPELAARKFQVAMAFHTDPGGIVRIRY